MQYLLSISEATHKLQEREKQAPSQDAKMMFERTINSLETELDELDYFYLSLFSEALIEAKKFSTANAFPFEHLGLVTHSLKEFSSSTS